MLFKKLIIERAKDLFELLMTLVVHKNRDVKENSLDAYEGVMFEIANGLVQNNRRH